MELASFLGLHYVLLRLFCENKFSKVGRPTSLCPLGISRICCFSVTRWRRTHPNLFSCCCVFFVILEPWMPTPAINPCWLKMKA